MLVTTSLGFAGLPATAHAQKYQPLGLTKSRSLERSAVVAQGKSRGSAKPYVIGGAIGGAVITAYLIKIAVEQSHDEMMMPPFLLAVPILGAAAVGAGVGYLVFRITR